MNDATKRLKGVTQTTAIATLTFIDNHEDDTFSHHFQDRCRYMTKFLNYLGGCRQLSYMDETFFTETLEKKNADIARIS